MTIPAFKSWQYDPASGEYSATIPREFRPGMEQTTAKALKTRGGYLSLTIDLPKRPRSTGPGSASAHMHGHCQQLSMAMGVPFETAKMYVKIRAAIELGYPSDMVKGVVLPQSEALATVEDETKLIDMTHIIASEYGLALIEEPGND